MASRAGSATSTFLVRERDTITTAAENALLDRHEQHYASASKEAVRQRLEVLYDQLLAAVSARDLTSVVAYAGSVAEERFQTGYDLSEVQAGFNALEEATWKRILTVLQPEDYRRGAWPRQHRLWCGEGRAWSSVRVARDADSRTFARPDGPLRRHRQRLRPSGHRRAGNPQSIRRIRRRPARVLLRG